MRLRQCPARVRSAFFAALVSIAASAAITLEPSVARADPPRALPGWAFGAPSGEAALMAVSAASLAAFLFPQHRGDWSPSNPRDPHQHAHEQTLSWATAIAGTVGVTGLSYVDEASNLTPFAPRPYSLAAPQLFADVEAGLLATGITNALKRSVGRCRPHGAERSGCPNHEHDAYPSGHSAPVGAVTGAHLVLALRAPTPGRWAAFGAAAVLGVTTATLRVLGGKHSWEDVVSGLAIGTATGSLVELAHPLRDTPSLGVSGVF
jgi:hypothetical protein